MLTNFVSVNPLPSESEGIAAAAPLGYVGEEAPVHEDVPGEGVGGGDNGRQDPQTEDGQVEDTLLQKWQ